MSTGLCVRVFEPEYASGHSFPVQHNVPKLLRAMLDAGKLNQTELAQRLGKPITQPQVSRWLRGQDPEGPNYNRIVALAEEMGVLTDTRSEDVAAALPETQAPNRVRLVGYVGAGSEMHYYRLADEEYEEVPAPRRVTDRTVAVEIRGKSMGPAVSGWLVFYDDIHSEVSPALHGRLCVVGLSDDRILVKRIQSQGNGLFTLLSNSDEAPIEDAQIEWAALVTSLEPRP